MAGVLTDELAKAQLFRFIDALPALGSAAAVVRHLHEYLDPVAHLLPRALAAGLALVGRRPALAPPAAAAARLGARLLARKFVAGSDADGVLGTIARLRARSSPSPSICSARRWSARRRRRPTRAPTAG